jgi:thiosulfate/3-mercaptopyruvate sulfurtransferase
MSDPVLDPRALSQLPGALLFDCRTGPGARQRHAEGHLPGARFVDLESDLAERGDPARGGRHPLPTATAFAARLGRWGVGPGTHVVIYDDQGGANAAARMWWMVRALGHERTYVLDGGLAGALAAGAVLTQELPSTRERPPYPAEAWRLPTADIDEVERARRSPSARVLDVRAAVRFRGEQEPIDPVAGHIPGAHNVPLSENLADGRFKSPEALRALYAPVVAGSSPEQLIVHCGSGVTACHTLLALERAGLTGAKLYVGSWSEWCRNPERPRAP